MSDVPIGAFLSGGVDSGMIVAMLAKAAGEGVTAFTVGFQHAGSGFIDERPYARKIAQRYGVRHIEIEVTPHVEEVVNEIVDAFDEPFADDSVFPTYYVCKVAAEHLKVILTGLGGDELFGGYKRHAGMALARSYQRVPRFLREGVVAPVARSLRETWLGADRVDHLKRFVRGSSLPAPQRYQDAMATLPWSERRALYQPGMLEHLDAAATDQVMTAPFAAPRKLGDVERALRCDLSVYLPDDVLALTDRLGMWHSLELRVPYLDHRLVELVAAVPERLKIDGMNQKVLLKQLARRWLPDDVIDHRKQGFESPMGAWLRGPLRDTMDRVLSRERIEAAGWFDWNAVQRLRAEHISGQRKHSKILFSMMMAHLWRERYAS